jgi:hypothetical protein
MNNDSSTDTQHQLPTDTGDAVAPSVAANRETVDLDFAAALDALRDGINDYGDRISASAAVLRAVDDLAVPADLLTHPRIEQAIWRYEHDPDTIRREIELTIEREDATVAVSDVVAAFRIAAVRLATPISTE